MYSQYFSKPHNSLQLALSCDSQTAVPWLLDWAWNLHTRVQYWAFGCTTAQAWAYSATRAQAWAYSYTREQRQNLQQYQDWSLGAQLHLSQSQSLQLHLSQSYEGVAIEFTSSWLLVRWPRPEHWFIVGNVGWIGGIGNEFAIRTSLI